MSILADAIKQAKHEREMITGPYYKKHQVCPKCRKRSFTILMIPVIVRTDEIFNDHRNITCDCGWTGIYHNLIEK